MSDLVYYGVWIDWSRGKYNGSTITLTPTGAGVLVASLALFVSLTGSSLWRIIAFFVHQQRVAKIPRDGLHYQQQAVLRNATAPGTATWQLLMLIGPWRKISNKSAWRTLILTLIALVNLLAFSAAGVLISEVTKAPGSEVLVRSPDCGYWTSNDTELLWPFLGKVLNDTVSAAAYARACYGGPTNALECNRYQTRSLPYTKHESEACPFSREICLGDVPTFVLDTGNVSSHDHFGINTPVHDRVSYRRRTACVPMGTDGYITTINYTDDVARSLPSIWGRNGDVIDLYNFGPQNFKKTSRLNYTYAYNRKQSVVGYGYSLEYVTKLLQLAFHQVFPFYGLCRADLLQICGLPKW